MVQEGLVWIEQYGTLKRKLYTVVHTRLDPRIARLFAREMIGGVIQKWNDPQFLTKHQKNARSRLY